MFCWLLSAIVLGTGGRFAALPWGRARRAKAAGLALASVAVSATLIGT